MGSGEAMDSQNGDKRWLWGLFVRSEMKVFTVIALVAGMGAAWYALPSDWSVSSRIFGGFLLGAVSVLFVFANRMIGGDDFGSPQ